MIYYCSIQKYTTHCTTIVHTYASVPVKKDRVATTIHKMLILYRVFAITKFCIILGRNFIVMIFGKIYVHMYPLGTWLSILNVVIQIIDKLPQIFNTYVTTCVNGTHIRIVLGDIEKLRCRYDMRKISRYNDIHDISCMVLFRKQTILFAYLPNL